MTPEQLEAHRVRFEQRFYAEFGLEPLRSGPGYVEAAASDAWQAYQWALDDVDRAQRAESAGWQHRIYYTDNNDPGWSKWREVMECDMETLQKLAREYPARHQMRQVYTAPQQSAQPVAWRPMETAPKDGTMIRLLVEFEHHATEDLDQCATIGVNSFENTKDEDVWQFAGWNWDQDCWTQGVGTPVGWLPMLNAAAQPVAAANGWAKGLEIRMSQGWKLKGGICPVLYSDTVNGYGVGRDDLWLATTDALKSAQPVEVQRVPLTDATQFEKDVARWMEKDGLTREQAECEVNYRTTRKALKSGLSAHGIKPTSSEGGA